jgi:hypothetical protein
MNQMGHGLPNMIGVKPGTLDQRVRPLLPGYMTMGQDGMGDMAEMGMPVPANSIPMVGAHGPHGYITMGGMFTILKVREATKDYSDPGWYRSPERETAKLAAEADLKRNGIDVGPANMISGSFTCRHHPDVISDTPGRCPRCNMMLHREDTP